ncbi:MAG: glutamine-hydrolyzing carbamoyl-phosphate synthase small subunit, partial [Kiritimatiellae bacterium]|nr:glutamine-hydrolyzing carbamoyl-phosphate synthase small subunit [Kiritimatiellia bacterium]
MMSGQRKAWIALEDGRVFEGEAFAGEGEVYGELVFNTSMTGYQEILTDPSYHQQVVLLTYPLIGNYGVNAEDVESGAVRPAALIVGEACRRPSNWRSGCSLKEYLERYGRLGVHRTDTRAITLHIRSRGAMKCVVSTVDGDTKRLVHKAREWPGFLGRDIASEVSTPVRYIWPSGHRAVAGFAAVSAEGERAYDRLVSRPAKDMSGYRVAVLDCGIKFNQLRLLTALGCQCEVFPMNTPAEEILATRPDGFLISNGPGDPGGVGDTVENIRKIVMTGVTTFGICFGHQLLGRVFGGTTYKLKFGHRGANQPVLDLSLIHISEPT